MTITALFSDDDLLDQIVLKGGNAMSLVHGLTERSSLDLDFSMEEDFADLEVALEQMRRGLERRFAPVGLVPFDVSLLPKPSQPGEDALLWWGGYRLEFKLVDEARFFRLRGNPEQLRRESTVVGPGQLRTFSVDFSKWEYTRAKAAMELDDYTIYVYPPGMIAIEKVRAICQQMEEYKLTGKTRRPRARDFYDIHTILTKTPFRFSQEDAVELLQATFAAKQVPVALLGKIAEQREFHRSDWPSVRGSTSGEIAEFDHYFDFVVESLRPLEALWME